MNSKRHLSANVFAFAVLVQLAVQPAFGQEVTQDSVDRAQKFLESAATAKMVLNYAHMGATYRSHSCDGLRNVVDRSGNRIPGEMAIVYRIHWDSSGAGWTDLAFFFNQRGQVTDLKVLDTNAVIQQPFLAADAAVAILGNLLIEAFKEELTAEDVRQIRTLVDSANSQALLLLSIRLRQSFEN